jgi:hypothetical protein
VTSGGLSRPSSRPAKGGGAPGSGSSAASAPWASCRMRSRRTRAALQIRISRSFASALISTPIVAEPTGNRGVHAPPSGVQPQPIGRSSLACGEGMDQCRGTGRCESATQQGAHRQRQPGERTRVKTRVRAAMSAQTATEGRFLGGRPLYGYRLVDAGPHPHPAKANEAIGSRLGVPRQIVSKWRKRFAEERIAGLTDRPRRGRPRRTLPSGR